MSSKLFLYDHPMSSYAQKVRMALRHKGLPFDKETPENLGAGHPNAAFSQANIRMEVPALIDGDFKIFDSTAILMYLEDAYPDTPSLFPSNDPKSKAEARMIEEILDTHYEAINWALGEINWFKRAEGAEAERLRAAAAEQIQQIQDWLSTQLGSKPFFSGEKVGYADFAVAPILNRSVINGNGPAPGSPLEVWWKRCGEVPAIKQTWDEVAEAAPKMAGLGPEAWKKGSGRKREYRDHRLEFLIKNGGIGIVQKGLEDDNIRFSWPHPRGGKL
ncbi:Glutathione S-transferase theta-2 [Pseudocercospora fuligena]|uniref:Glutathione S-transferase theta-2 n=1 Tax=Pseudocercospora fuligena TaxID=685502 RepID=A0A8H6RBM7_9PEZI|nr:Glutathione S-transferase theta-2 [Pseudocercospora fuligena]